MALSDTSSGGGAGNSARVGLRVLVVEDDNLVGGTLLHLLQHYGYVPKLVGSVAEALRHLEGWRPDTLLLDLMLPDGNGTGVLRHVRHVGHRCRVAVLTAVDDPDQLRPLNALRPDRVFLKPVDFLQLKAWLDEHSGVGAGGPGPTE